MMNCDMKVRRVQKRINLRPYNLNHYSRYLGVDMDFLKVSGVPFGACIDASVSELGI